MSEVTSLQQARELKAAGLPLNPRSGNQTLVPED